LVKRQRKSEVIDYLNKENEYYQKMTAHTQEFQKELFEEMKRIKEDDESVPIYTMVIIYTRFEKGKDYPIYSRKKESFRQKKKSCSTVTN
jgi:oligopeptidase B